MHLARAHRTSRRASFRTKQGEGDKGFAWVAAGGNDLAFQFSRDRHFAGRHFVFCRSDEAEVAAAETRLTAACGHARGRAEDATGHRPVRVDIAQAGHGVQRGTGCFVGEGFKTGLLFRGRAENAGCAIARELRTIGSTRLAPGAGAFLKRLYDLRSCGTQRRHSGLKTRDVEGVDREGAITALGAARPAGEPGARATRPGLREGGVKDPESELRGTLRQQILARWPHRRYMARGPRPSDTEFFGQLYGQHEDIVSTRGRNTVPSVA